MVAGTESSYRLLLLFACLCLLIGCAMEPKLIRGKLDECDKHDFDALVFTRKRDGAVTDVLCVPKSEEIDHTAIQPTIIPSPINRWLPRRKRSQRQHNPEPYPGAQAQ